MPRHRPIKLDYKLLAQLSQVGVRRIYMTKECYDKLAGSLKGLFKPEPDAPEEDMDKLAGIEIFTLEE